MRRYNTTIPENPLSRNPAARLAAQAARTELLRILQRSDSHEQEPFGIDKDLVQLLENSTHRLLLQLVDISGIGEYTLQSLPIVPALTVLIERGFIEFLMHVSFDFLSWDDLYAQSGTTLLVSSFLTLARRQAGLGNNDLDLNNNTEQNVGCCPRVQL